MQYQCYSCKTQCTTVIPNEKTDEFIKDMLDPNKYKVCNDCWNTLEILVNMGYMNPDVRES